MTNTSTPPLLHALTSRRIKYRILLEKGAAQQLGIDCRCVNIRYTCKCHVRRTRAAGSARSSKNPSHTDAVRASVCVIKLHARCDVCAGARAFEWCNVVNISLKAAAESIACPSRVCALLSDFSHLWAPQRRSRRTSLLAA